jgi:hypothetical protein
MKYFIQNTYKLVINHIISDNIDNIILNDGESIIDTTQYPNVRIGYIYDEDLDIYQSIPNVQFPNTIPGIGEYNTSTSFEVTASLSLPTISPVSKIDVGISNGSVEGLTLDSTNQKLEFTLIIDEEVTNSSEATPINLSIGGEFKDVYNRSFKGTTTSFVYTGSME